jgi:hypothetical protein
VGLNRVQIALVKSPEGSAEGLYTAGDSLLNPNLPSSTRVPTIR